ETFVQRASLQKTRKIYAEDLLSRAPVELNTGIIKNNFNGKTVLITGAGGSIGSEICHQLLFYPVTRLICMGRGEYSLYKLKEKLEAENKNKIKINYYLGNIKDRERLAEIFDAEHPDIIFHAAAHKHVPFMEENEKEAVKNNIIGTANVLAAAVTFKVRKFILISTDKAVNPANVMGASKRAAELLTGFYYNKYKLNIAIVRFGNVLGSRGSVVPLFRKQIMNGGPITVTHPEVVRFFMTIPEAAQLTINCGAMSRGGERFILDMGKPVKIDSLVRRMIRLYGYEPDKDIKIKYTGLRRGEKIYEQLMTDQEKFKPTKNKRIFICTDSTENDDKIVRWLEDIKHNMGVYDNTRIRKKLAEVIPEYKENSIK
ncbi:MAG TPA: SDR family NAD(P)-dependent oxidoreductase, partial [Spirochaetota bacterium]|nr:SDR family NAD(P)-dependent oxidoreductase [Spirochaetota bacterium]